MGERNEHRPDDHTADAWQAAAQLVRERIRECRSCSSDFADLARQFDRFATQAREPEYAQARRPAS